MTIQLHQGNIRRQSPRPKEVYRLTMKAMIGDADGWNSSNRTFQAACPQQVQHLHRLLELLDAYAKLGWNAQCDVNDYSGWSNLATSLFGEDLENLDDPHYDLYEDLAELTGYEPYDTGNLAAPSEWSVTYFDEKGDEYEVVAKIAGADVKTSR